jgi:hypothetical protein
MDARPEFGKADPWLRQTQVSVRRGTIAFGRRRNRGRTGSSIRLLTMKSVAAALSLFACFTATRIRVHSRLPMAWNSSLGKAADIHEDLLRRWQL